MIFIWLLVAWALERVHIMAAGNNYGATHNGIGAVENVLTKKGYAPAVYRVLVPWMIYPFWKKGKYVTVAYEIAKIILIAGALWSISLAWGWQVAFVVAAILPVTFEYDYWDWASELIGISLCLTGNIYLASFGAVVHGLSRETSIILPVAFIFGLQWHGKLFDQGSWVQVGIVALIVAGCFVALRLIQGKHKFCPDCKRFPIQNNINDLRNMFLPSPFFMCGIFISIVLTLLTIATSWVAGWSMIIPLAFVVAAYTLTQFAESRVFAPVLPWIAYAVVRLCM